jgi:hypothetical protein
VAFGDEEIPSGEAEIGSEELGETIDAGLDDSQVEEPQYDFLDVEANGGKHVTMKIDGEDVVVPLSEALAAYNRESVSTRRFQEAAEIKRQADEALRLQEALQYSPGLTVRILAEQAGKTVEEFLGMTPAQQQAALEEPEYSDPLERELATERAARIALEQRLDQREADERLDRAVGQLKQAYGASDEQTLAVVREAHRLQLGTEYLPMIYEAMAHRAQQQAGAQLTAQQEAEAQRRRQEAARAAQLVGTGSGAAGTTETAPSAQYKSIREAAAAAIDEVEAGQR